MLKLKQHLLNSNREPYILSKKWDIFIVVYALWVLFCIMGQNNLNLVTDYRFLYNRAYQFYTNIQNGGSIFFFYNDFDGVGYGSTFFYGYLTLLPFLPFVSLGFISWIKLYFICTIVTIYFGVQFLSKRFSQNYRLISIVYMGSYFVYLSFYVNCLVSNHFAFGLSLFFLGYCIDFFRDNKKYSNYLACVFFFLIVNTHLITSVFAFVGCVVVFCFYFSKKRLLEYVLFATTNLLLNLYFFCNIIYHKDSLRTVLNDNARGWFSSDKFPFGGSISLLFGVPSKGFHYVNFFMFVLFLLLLIYRPLKFSLKEKLSICIFIVGAVLAINTVWKVFYEKTNIFFQFPCRYTYFTFLVLLIIILRYKITKKMTVLLLCSMVLDLLLTGFIISKPEVADDDENRYWVINGEYLSNEWEWNYEQYLKLKSEVADQNGVQYEYTEDKKGTITVVVPEHDEELTLTFPKLYYRGYVCTNEKNYTVEKGISNFIKVCIGKDNGTFTLKYKHPLWLQILFWIDIIFFLQLFCICLFPFVKNSKVYKHLRVVTYKVYQHK